MVGGKLRLPDLLLDLPHVAVHGLLDFAAPVLGQVLGGGRKHLGSMPLAR